MKKVKVKYSSGHNWIELKRKVVTIGITDYLIGELGDLIDLCLPKVGEEVIDGIPYGEVESINTLRDFYFANKGSSSQGYGFSYGHVWM